MRIPPGTNSARGTYLKWLRRIAASVAVLLVLVLGAALLNNNVSIRRPSRAQFVGNLDRTLALHGLGARAVSADCEGKRHYARRPVSSIQLRDRPHGGGLCPAFQ
jgi:hypothetical protein